MKKHELISNKLFKKIFYFIILSVFIEQNAIAQLKPELPPNFYDAFSYSLPGSFNYNDSTQLSNEITKIASQLLKWHNDAASNYSNTDSTDLYYFLSVSSDLNIFFNKHDGPWQFRQVFGGFVYV